MSVVTNEKNRQGEEFYLRLNNLGVPCGPSSRVVNAISDARAARRRKVLWKGWKWSSRCLREQISSREIPLERMRLMGSRRDFHVFDLERFLTRHCWVPRTRKSRSGYPSQEMKGLVGCHVQPRWRSVMNQMYVFPDFRDRRSSQECLCSWRILWRSAKSLDSAAPTCGQRLSDYPCIWREGQIVTEVMVMLTIVSADGSSSHMAGGRRGNCLMYRYQCCQRRSYHPADSTYVCSQGHWIHF